MKICLVDDSDTCLLYLWAILEGEGYADLHTAPNAELALVMLLDFARRNEPVDLVLMDISMPGLDGIEATRLIKENPELSSTQVFIVTATDDLETLEKAFEAGATDYLTKPVHKVQLRARVRSALRLKQEMDKRQSREQDLEKLTKQLTELSNKDGLTQVPNRRYFDEQYLKEYRRAQRDGSPLCLMMIDIDFFKAYNDAYGHLDGDTCLKRVAQAVSSVVNRPGDLVARYGGEEFVVLLPATDRNGAWVIAQAIQMAIKKLDIEHRSSRIAKQLTLSIGIACQVPARDKTSPEKLLNLADKALYKSKSQGRNTISFADALGSPGNSS